MPYGSGVPIDRLKVIVENLTSFGLVQTITDEEEEGVFYILTPRTLEFLETFWKMKGFLEVFVGKVSSNNF